MKKQVTKTKTFYCSKCKTNKPLTKKNDFQVKEGGNLICNNCIGIMEVMDFHKTREVPLKNLLGQPVPVHMRKLSRVSYKEALLIC